MLSYQLFHQEIDEMHAASFRQQIEVQFSTINGVLTSCQIVIVAFALAIFPHIQDLLGRNGLCFLG